MTAPAFDATDCLWSLARALGPRDEMFAWAVRYTALAGSPQAALDRAWAGATPRNVLVLALVAMVFAPDVAPGIWEEVLTGRNYGLTDEEEAMYFRRLHAAGAPRFDGCPPRRICGECRGYGEIRGHDSDGGWYDASTCGVCRGARTVPR